MDQGRDIGIRERRSGIVIPAQQAEVQASPVTVKNALLGPASPGDGHRPPRCDHRPGHCRRAPHVRNGRQALHNRGCPPCPSRCPPCCDHRPSRVSSASPLLLRYAVRAVCHFVLAYQVKGNLPPFQHGLQLRLQCQKALACNLACAGTGGVGEVWMTKKW